MGNKLFKKIDNKPKLKIIVYGEAHFHFDEVEDIRDSIIKNKPDYILLENIEDKQLYLDIIPNIVVKRLEPVFNNKELSLLEQFKVRENNMIGRINKLISSIKVDSTICIQTGDTHLRSIKTKELGENILRKYLDILSKDRYITVNINRSKYKEIK